MDELGARVSIDAALNIIERGSYEARAEMLILFEKGLLERLGDREIRLARQHVPDLAKHDDEELAGAAALAGTGCHRRDWPRRVEALKVE